MVIYLYGADTARSRHYLKEQVAKFKASRDPQGYNVIFIDAAKESPGTITGELLAVPFLAPRRLIVLENLLNNAAVDFLSEFGKRVTEKTWPESNVIIVWQGQTPGKTKIAKTLHEVLSKEKYAEEFPSLTPAQLPVWIQAYLKNHSRVATQAALDFLVRQESKDSWELQCVLDQLIAYTGQSETPITADMCALFLEEKKADNIFNLVDAVLSGNHKNARLLLNEARLAGLEDGYLFAMLTKQLHSLLLIRDCFDNMSPFVSDMAAKELGLHPFVVKKSLPLIKRMPLSEFKKMQGRLLEIDRQVKNGLGSLPALIEVFIGTV